MLMVSIEDCQSSRAGFESRQDRQCFCSYSANGNMNPWYGFVLGSIPSESTPFLQLSWLEQTSLMAKGLNAGTQVGRWFKSNQERIWIANFKVKQQAFNLQNGARYPGGLPMNMVRSSVVVTQFAVNKQSRVQFPLPPQNKLKII